VNWALTFQTTCFPWSTRTTRITHSPLRPRKSCETLTRSTAYGAQLVAATVIGQKADRGETQFTSVLSAYRGRGIGKAVKAASILALAEDGLRLFSTGGAGVNEASLGANRALGYTIEERWRSYERDIGSATPNSYGCSWV
jgi:GNAT superfamily N-acetyltransferase